MQKRKIENYYKYIIVNYFLILIFIILSCEINKKLDENRKPGGQFIDTLNITKGLICERYYSLSKESIELFLTDSNNYRIFVMSYSHEYNQHYKIKMDSSKITFYCKYFDHKPVNIEKESEYTFEELKTKNNLRKGK